MPVPLKIGAHLRRARQHNLRIQPDKEILEMLGVIPRVGMHSFNKVHAEQQPDGLEGEQAGKVCD